jgi:hypothetical protein
VAKKSADLSLCIKSNKYQEVLQHLADLEEGNEEVTMPLLFSTF